MITVLLHTPAVHMREFRKNPKPMHTTVSTSGGRNCHITADLSARSGAVTLKLSGTWNTQCRCARGEQRRRENAHVVGEGGERESARVRVRECVVG